MSFLEPGASPFLRLMNASWPLFRASGVRVRIHWTTVLVPLLLWAGFATWLGPGEAALWAGAWSIAAYAVIWTHEMGHVWAGRTLGVETTQVTLWPLGGLAHLGRDAPSPRAEAWIALAGPATHAVWLVLAGAPVLFLLEGSSAGDATWAVMLRGFAGLNAALLFLNLLPFWPMDGGRAMRAFLAMRVHANHASLLTSYAGFAGAAVLGIVGVAMMVEGGSAAVLTDVGGPVLVGIAITNFSACRLLLAEARWGEGPYERVRPPRAPLPRAKWLLEEPDLPKEPVAVERRPAAAERRTRTAVEPAVRREVARPAPRPLQERIDELLDRINEVGGVEKLTEAERRELAEASDRLRRGDR